MRPEFGEVVQDRHPFTGQRVRDHAPDRRLPLDLQQNDGCGFRHETNDRPDGDLHAAKEQRTDVRPDVHGFRGVDGRPHQTLDVGAVLRRDQTTVVVLELQ